MAQIWECPKCPARAQTVDDKIPMHPCPAGPGVLVPLLRAGEKAKIAVLPPEDYVGGELVQTDASGKPVMAVVTTRDEGQDCTVFAPVAQGKRED